MNSRIAKVCGVLAFCGAALFLVFAPRGDTLAEGEEPNLSVEIAIPQKNGKRSMPLSGEFHVVVTNNSSAPVKIFSQSCVEGRRQLLFEFIDGIDCWSVCRKIENVRRNIRVAETLDPGEPMVIHVNLSSDAWDHPVPLDQLKGRKLKVRAVFIGGAGPISGMAHIRSAVDSTGKEIDPGAKPDPTPRPKPEVVEDDTWAGTATSGAERTYSLY